MDFGLDNLLYSNSPSNNGSSFTSETDADVNKHRLYGSVFFKQERTVDEDDLRAFKLAKTSCQKTFLQGCNLSEHQQQMLSFSSPNSQMLSFASHNSLSAAFPFNPHTSTAINRSSGYCCGGVNGTSMHGVRGLFTASQWMELEHQALIYKYITANVPIPSYLLNPIKKALESSGFSCFSILRPNALGWGANFQLGFSNTDPEPGRCRRTDGKKWRCSRDAVPDQKYCERHINRGRHRSRKPVEPQPAHSASATTTSGKLMPAASATSASSVGPAGCASKSLSLLHHSGSYIASSRPDFGSVWSNSLLNPLEKSSSLVNSTNYGNSDNLNDGTQLSISITSDFMPSTASPINEKLRASPLRLSQEIEATQMGLSVGAEQSQRQNNWVPVSWERSIGGPLGEALHSTSECKNSKALNLIDNWDHSPRAESSRTTLDGPTFYNGFINQGLLLPSLPAL